MKNEIASPLPSNKELTNRGNTPRFEVDSLLQGHRVIELMHAGQRYFLRLTRENKLMLTK